MTNTHLTLVVSPDPGLVNQVRGAVDSAGMQVENVPTAEHALEWLGETTPPLVIAEVDLPGFTGYELCRQVKEGGGPPFPFLLVHREGDVRAQEECAAAGADASIGRPFQSQQLEDIVRDLVPEPPSPALDAPDPDGPSQSVELSIDDGSLDSATGSVDGSISALGSLDSDSIRSVDTAELVAYHTEQGGEADVLGPSTGRRSPANSFLPPTESMSDGEQDPIQEAVARQLEDMQVAGSIEQRIQSAVLDAVRDAVAAAVPEIAREAARILREDGED